MSRSQTKQTIFDEATRLFSEQGYAETTVREISFAAHINEATIYIYFKAKSDILGEILDAFESKLDRCFFVEKYVNIHSETENPRKLLRRLFWTPLLEDDLFMQQAFRIVCMEQFKNPKAEALVRDKFHGKMAENIRHILNKLIALGEIPDFDTYSLSTLWAHAMFSSAVMATHSLSDGTQNNLQTDNELLLEMAVSGKIPINRDWIMRNCNEFESFVG